MLSTMSSVQDLANGSIGQQRHSDPSFPINAGTSRALKDVRKEHIYWWPVTPRMTGGSFRYPRCHIPHPMQATALSMLPVVCTTAATSLYMLLMQKGCRAPTLGAAATRWTVCSRVLHSCLSAEGIHDAALALLRERCYCCCVSRLVSGMSQKCFCPYDCCAYCSILWSCPSSSSRRAEVYAQSAGRVD
jgi:hypothetical protein